MTLLQMDGTILLSTAYLPPLDYFLLIAGADKIFIEKEENYIKQTWRNRCRILSSNGPLTLTVPVKKGDSLKNPVSSVMIDYTKRWQQVHLRAILSSYGSAPWFQFYFERFEEILLSGEEFLIDLNHNLLQTIMDLLGIKTQIEYTGFFDPVSVAGNDYRYTIRPGKTPFFKTREYTQVFSYKSGFVPGLSIIDLLFNLGPESLKFLRSRIQ